MFRKKYNNIYIIFTIYKSTKKYVESLFMYKCACPYLYGC